MSGDYQLRVRVPHMRRRSMAALLFGLAQQALIAERRGEAYEQVHCHLTGDGDYSAIAVVYPAAHIENAGPASSGTTETSSDVAEDDISAAERIRNQDQRDADEAARLQAIELQKQIDAYALRRAAEGHND